MGEVRSLVGQDQVTPLEIALPCLAAYLASWLGWARAAYRHFRWDSYTSEGEKRAFSLMQGAIWPVFLLGWFATLAVAAPTRTERKIERRTRLEEDIRRLERELSIGGLPLVTRTHAPPPLPETFGALLLLWLRNRMK